jgi:hypothetical protein
MDWRLSCWLLCHQFLASCLRSNKHYRYLFHLGQEAKIKANFCTEARLQVFSCPTIMKVDFCSPPKLQLNYLGDVFLTVNRDLSGFAALALERSSHWSHSEGQRCPSSMRPIRQTSLKHVTNQSDTFKIFQSTSTDSQHSQRELLPHRCPRSPKRQAQLWCSVKALEQLTCPMGPMGGFHRTDSTVRNCPASLKSSVALPGADLSDSLQMFQERDMAR